MSKKVNIINNEIKNNKVDKNLVSADHNLSLSLSLLINKQLINAEGVK